MGHRTRLWTRSWSHTLASCFGASRAIVRPGLLIVLLVVLVPVSVLMIQSELHATGNTITVNTTDDPGTPTECSLRAAINNANNQTSDANSTCAAGTGQDTINFSVSGGITLGSTLPAIANTSPGNLTIDATGQSISLEGFNPVSDSYVQVMVVNSGATLTLKNLAIDKGNGGGSGGAIVNNGTLAISNCTIMKSTAPSGMNGGAISNLGTLTVSNSTFSGNSAGADGGGIFNNGGTLTVTNSTFSSNGAGSSGGGIYNSGAATITNSTFSGNTSASGGGAIFHASGTLSVSNSTISGNGDSSAGGGIDNAAAGGSVSIGKSILSGNTNGNCAGSSVTNGGLNISDDATCGFGSATGANGQTIGDSVNSKLDPNGLLYNGGPTQTIGLQAGSPAIAAIATANCPAADQRGATRPALGQNACDIGAFELGGVVPTGGAPIEYYVGSAGTAGNLAGPGSLENLTVNSTTGVASGDLVLLALFTSQYGCSAGSAYTITPPAGFTAVTMASGSNPLFNWDGGDGVAEVFQKTAGASEPSSYTFSVVNPCDGDSALLADYGITVWSNVASTPVDTAGENVSAATCLFGDSCLVVANSLTTTVANDMLVPIYFAGGRGTTWSCTLPGGYNPAWSFVGATTDGYTCGGYNSQSGIGSTGSLTASIIGNDPAGSPGLAFLVAVAPASAATPTPTATATATPTATATSTANATATPTATATATNTSHCHSNRYCNADSDCDEYGYSNRDEYGHCNCDADGDRHSDRDRYGNADRHSNGDTDYHSVGNSVAGIRQCCRRPDGYEESYG